MCADRKSCFKHLSQSIRETQCINHAEDAVRGIYDPAINQGFFDILIALSHGYSINRSRVWYPNIHPNRPIYFSMICYILLRLHWIRIVKYCRYPFSDYYRIGYTICTLTPLGKLFVNDTNIKHISNRLFRDCPFQFPTLNDIVRSKPSHLSDLVCDTYCNLESVSVDNNRCQWAIPYWKSVTYLTMIQFLYRHQNTYKKLEKEHDYSRSLRSLLNDYMFSDRYIPF